MWEPMNPVAPVSATFISGCLLSRLMVGVEGESSWTWTAGHNSFGDVASIAEATERHGAGECGRGRAHGVRNGLEYLGATGCVDRPRGHQVHPDARGSERLGQALAVRRKRH